MNKKCPLPARECYSEPQQAWSETRERVKPTAAQVPRGWIYSEGVILQSQDPGGPLSSSRLCSARGRVPPSWWGQEAAGLVFWLRCLCAPCLGRVPCPCTMVFCVVGDSDGFQLTEGVGRASQDSARALTNGSSYAAVDAAVSAVSGPFTSCRLRCL